MPNTGDAAADHRGRPSSPTSGERHGDELAVRFAALARTLQDQDDVQATLQSIVDAAVDTIPGAQHAGITLVERRRRINTQVGTGALAFQVDMAQGDVGEGPCLDAAYEQRTVRLDDMSAEQRWPKFTARAVSLGVRSMLSFQLFVKRDNLGALNLCSGKSNAFDDESEHVGLLFAAHAAVAMSGAQDYEQLSKAVSARDLIGQAKGILMERYKVTAAEAFVLLTRVSQDSNTKLTDVARRLAESGEFTRSRRDR